MQAVPLLLKAHRTMSSKQRKENAESVNGRKLSPGEGQGNGEAKDKDRSPGSEEQMKKGQAGLLCSRGSWVSQYVEGSRV